MSEISGAWWAVGSLAPIVWLGALLVSTLLIRLLMPVFRDVALAVPTQRSSHQVPTPQWGGLAISIATLGAAALGLIAADVAPQGLVLALVAALLLIVLGGVDDLHNLGPGVKLAVQAAAVALVIGALPDDLRACHFLPPGLERAVLFVGTLWFVNLVNFMDGIDWMMVAEVVPLTAGIAVIGALGALPPAALILALALNGAMLGFAPYNRPVARLFMGDMGSLPTGLLLAWLLIVVAGSGYLVAALLLPLYFIADTGVTLFCRVRLGERPWRAHRAHFYQRAQDNGFSVPDVVGRVFAVNFALVGLAALSVVSRSTLSQMLALLAGACLVAAMMISFSRPRR